MNNNLLDYAEYQKKIDDLTKLRDECAVRVEAETRASGNQSCPGFVAFMKAGRKKIDHQEASMFHAGADLVEKHTTTKTTSSTAWAKITKEAAIDLAPYTTQAEPSFVIERE